MDGLRLIQVDKPQEREAISQKVVGAKQISGNLQTRNSESAGPKWLSAAEKMVDSGCGAG